MQSIRQESVKTTPHVMWPLLPQEIRTTFCRSHKSGIWRWLWIRNSLLLFSGLWGGHVAKSSAMMGSGSRCSDGPHRLISKLDPVDLISIHMWTSIWVTQTTQATVEVMTPKKGIWNWWFVYFQVAEQMAVNHRPSVSNRTCQVLRGIV